MEKTRLISCLACAVIVIVISSGCQAIDGHRSVLVQVIDADTRQPIGEAQTRSSYPLANPVFGPADSYGNAGRDGIALLSASTHADSRLLLEVHAENYLPEHRFVAVESVRAIKPVGWFQSVDRRPPDLIVEMIREKPLPTIELVIPTDHRGLLEVDLQIAENAPNVPGQREFSFAVPVSGSVRVTEPAILGRFPVINFTARFADGTPISRDPKNESDIGLWQIKREGKKYTFMIGTKVAFAVYRDQHPTEMAVGPTPAHSPVGGGGGRGRGGRRGASQTDSGSQPPD